MVQIAGIIFPSFYSSTALNIFPLMSKSFNKIGRLEYRVIKETHFPQFLETVNS
jgi:hypothetical protein